MIRLPARTLMSLLAAGMFAVASVAHADDFADIDRLITSGQFPEALQRADKVLSANPSDTRMRFIKGLILSEQGKTNEAIAIFSKLATDHPTLPEPHNNLAVLYSKQGQFEKARGALESAIRTNPSYATAYENLGDIYAKLASQAYSKALQMDGSNTNAAPKLAMIRDIFSTPGSSRVNLGTAVARAPTPAPSPVAPTPAPAPAPAPAVKPAPAPAPVAAAVPRPAPAPVAAVAPKAPPAQPPAPVTPAPSPVPAVPKPAASSEESAVVAATQSWARAWSGKDMNAYFAAYTREHTGTSRNRKSWENDRRARILGKRSISVVLSNIKVVVKGDRATAQFHQAYRADGLNLGSPKRLELVRVSGAWLIEKESTGS